MIVILIGLAVMTIEALIAVAYVLIPRRGESR